MHYFIGIGGIGMSALAHFLLQKGLPVMGSDCRSSEITKSLEAAGAQIFLKQQKENVPASAHVIYSTDIKIDHPERVRALELGLKISHRSELLAELMDDYKALMIAGVHGKTSTTGLLTHVLRVAGEDPAYIVGGLSPSFPFNGGYGKGSYFVAEADESDGSFLKGRPYGAIVTNVDAEHLNYWGDFSSLVNGFKQFCQKPQQELIYCADDPHLEGLELRGTSYRAEQILHWEPLGSQMKFTVKIGGVIYKDICLNAIGFHQALNALAVMTLVLNLGISESALRTAFATFQGMKRRAEYLGEKEGVIYYDDYAHHPTEIRAILSAFRSAFPDKRLIALFQPHRFSRFASLYNEFFKVFNDCDELIVTDIYGAYEPISEGVTAQGFAAQIGEKKARYVHKEELESYLETFLKEGDLLLTLGAGDITHIGRSRLVQASALA